MFENNPVVALKYRVPTLKILGRTRQNIKTPHTS